VRHSPWPATEGLAGAHRNGKAKLTEKKNRAEKARERWPTWWGRRLLWWVTAAVLRGAQVSESEGELEKRKA
jgi:hypothetical protein